MTDVKTVQMMADYKAWANRLTFGAVMALPESESLKVRATRFGTMVHTLNHIYVIDAIFRAHLEGTAHGYTARNTETHPPLAELWQQQRAMDAWYIGLATRLTAPELAEPVHFQFVDGGAGVMTRGEMILHVVNHGTYHRGFVGDMMYQIPTSLPANDLPVYLREKATA